LGAARSSQNDRLPETGHSKITQDERRFAGFPFARKKMKRFPLAILHISPTIPHVST
jgi:hypothetical protein